MILALGNGDDGEMQCNALGCGLDFLRLPFDDLQSAVSIARLKRKVSAAERPAQTWQPPMELIRALGDVVARTIDFNERTQTLRCRRCGSEPELGDHGKLHRNGCSIYTIQDFLERIGATKDGPEPAPPGPVAQEKE